MESASAPEDYVYQGVWINWLKGNRVFGATLTVDPDTASILSPALAVVISIAGSQLWRLFQFALHQSRATSHDMNFLYHQQQITLRNTATDLNTLWRLIRLAFAWRRHSDIRIFRQSWPLITWTSLHLTLFILASLFSSWLLQAGNYVLSRSQWCGQYNADTMNAAYYGNWSSYHDVSTAFEYANHVNSRYALVQQQIDICDNSNHSCVVTPINKITCPSNVVSHHCPFAGSICHPKNETVVFDTGYLSSATHLGFNAATRDRIAFRLLAQCAPLDDAKYVSGWKFVNETSGLHQVSDAYYGPVPNGARNATFSFTKLDMQCEQRRLLPRYVLKSEWSQPPSLYRSQTFEPIPELQLTDADLSLVMLMANSIYEGPVTDPWFTAQLATNETNAYCLNEDKTLYTREIPLTTMACKQQWQICNTDSPSGVDNTRCTELQGISQMYDTFGAPEQFKTPYTPQQLATANRLIQAASASSFYYLVSALGQTNGAPLKARGLISSTVGIAPPDTQWQTETKYWMEILLAYLQQNSMDYSTGQFSYKTRYIDVTTPSSDPADAAYYSLCQNQLIQSAVYRNFNFFALLFCVILCTIITIVGLSIEDAIGYIRQHRSRDTAHHDKQDMWVANSDLEMFRMLMELKKNTQWGRSPFGIPFAPAGEKASIRDLRRDVLEAKAGHGIINKNVERRQTATKDALSSKKRRAHSHSTCGGRKSCATCESFETLPSSKDIACNGTLPTDLTAQHGHPGHFHFANEILAQRMQSDVPLLRDDSQQRQETQAPHTNGYGIVPSNETIVVNAMSRIQTFHQRIRMPVSRDVSTDSDAVREESGRSTPAQIHGDSGQSRDDVVFESDQRQSVLESDSDNEIRVGRTRGIWPWSRRNDNNGTIC